MQFKEINKDNWILFAAQHYDGTGQTLKDFHDDLKRFKYINKLFFRLRNGDNVNIKLILNHLIIVTNLFGPEVGTTLLFFRIKPKYWSELKTFMFFLGMIEDQDFYNIEISEGIIKKIKESGV